MSQADFGDGRQKFSPEQQKQILLQQKHQQMQMLSNDPGLRWYSAEWARQVTDMVPKGVIAIPSTQKKLILQDNVQKMLTHLETNLCEHIIERYPLLVITDPAELAIMNNPWIDAFSMPAKPGFWWVYTDKEETMKGQFYDKIGWEDEAGHKIFVTHYMPLPLPPVKVFKQEQYT